MTATHETVEELVRSKLSEALGGRRGIVESAVPTVLFTGMFVSTHELRLSLIVSIVATELLLVVRLVQRSTVQFVLNALIGIGIAALFASRTGRRATSSFPASSTTVRTRRCSCSRSSWAGPSSGS